NAFGEQVASSPGLSPGVIAKQVVVEASPGVYFIRVSAPRAEDASVYTVVAEWGVGATPPVAKGEGAPPPPPPTETPPSETPPPESAPDDENGVEGRIVSSYREGAALVLHLDKGTAAGIKVGTGGFVLDGPSGQSHLDGGGFTVTQVV